MLICMKMADRAGFFRLAQVKPAEIGETRSGWIDGMMNETEKANKSVQLTVMSHELCFCLDHLPGSCLPLIFDRLFGVTRPCAS
jgi:hypothetical protein